MTSTRSPRKMTALRALGLKAFLFLGSILLVSGGYEMWMAVSSKTWTPASGRITRSGVQEHRSKQKGTGYLAVISYDYTVGRRRYSATRVRFGDFGGAFSSDGRRVVERYPAGSAVTVFVSPRNPRAAVLEPGFQLETLVLAAIGLFVVVPSARHLARAAGRGHVLASPSAPEGAQGGPNQPPPIL